GHQRLPGEPRKTLVNQAMAAMLPFWPRIWKINMECACNIGRQQIFEKIRGLDAYAAQVFQGTSSSLTIQFPNSAQQTLHADKIAVEVLAGVVNKERAIATAQLHLQRLRFGKDVCQI